MQMLNLMEFVVDINLMNFYFTIYLLKTLIILNLILLFSKEKLSKNAKNLLKEIKKKPNFFSSNKLKIIQTIFFHL